LQDKLRKLRNVIREAAPDAEEKISYQIPAFALHEDLVYFAAFKNHIGFYPTGSGVAAFQEELSGYKTGRGSIQFPIDKPVPYELVRRIVKFRVAESLKKYEAKKKV
jgi:uncharacterized protein YdhG (YjbR/CyaY superfamily)